MEEYLHYMRTLRTQMNDVEDQAAKVSVEEQMQITTIHTLEKDLRSAKSETKQVMEETEQMVKSRGDICSKILEKQKRIASLESDSLNLSQTLELIQQERSNLSAKLDEKSAYYNQVAMDMISKLQEQKHWLDVTRQNEIPEEDNMQTDQAELMCGKEHDATTNLGDEEKDCQLRNLRAEETKLDEIIRTKTRLVSENRELKQSIEQLKREIHDLKPELSAMEMSTLEEEHKALLSEKDEEMKYHQSLQSHLEKLASISHVVKCACGGEYRVEMV